MSYEAYFIVIFKTLCSTSTYNILILVGMAIAKDPSRIFTL